MFFLLDPTRKVLGVVGPFPSSDMAWKWAHEVTPDKVWEIVSCILPKDWRDE